MVGICGETMIEFNEEQPLLDMIEDARSKNLCIMSKYQQIYFTPDELEQCHAGGSFRWWNLGNWELRKLPANCITYGGLTTLDLYGEKPDNLQYWKERVNMLEKRVIELDIENSKLLNPNNFIVKFYKTEKQPMDSGDLPDNLAWYSEIEVPENEALNQGITYRIEERN